MKNRTNHNQENARLNLFNGGWSKKPKPLEELLVKGSNCKNHNLKKRLIKKKYFEEKCVICGQLSIWNNKKLVLVLDHINGIHNDNTIENLRLLCPNCHSQTDTYAGKNHNKIKKPKKKCIECGKILSNQNKSGMCKDCYIKYKNNNRSEKTKKRYEGKSFEDYKNKGLLYNDQEIINKYYEVESIKKTAEVLQISKWKVSRVLNQNNIDTKQFEYKPVKQFDKEGNLIKIYKSISDAAKSLGDENKSRHIISVCKGKRKFAYGYKWEYIT